jgi:hypothetical protein
MKPSVELNKMRRYRGTDDAVQLIGSRDPVHELLKNSNAHTRNKLIDLVMSNYCGDAYGDANWTKVYSAWGDRPEIVTVHGDFANQHPSLSQLNLDPGFITHLPEFMGSSDNNISIDYSIAREEFKDALGTKTVWRGMVLSKDEAEKMTYEGIKSSFFRKTFEMPSVIDNFEANILSVYFDTLADVHFHGENVHSPLISVSDHKDVAIAVGRHFGKRSSSKEKKDFYLFEIEVPEIDLIYFVDHAAKMPGKLKSIADSGRGIHTTVNESEQFHSWSREVESFLMYKINPEEIINITKPDIYKSSWNGRITKKLN